MSALGILLIHYIQVRDVSTVLTGKKNHYLQTIAGLFFGSLSALLALALINSRRFKDVYAFLEEMLKDIAPSVTHILFYSFCAAVGEEVLFRAGLQPLIGIWPAAIVFVLLHGYINPMNLNLSIYGIFLIIICAGFGYMFKYFGLTACIVAHFVYDVAMFSALKYSRSSTN